MRRPQVLHKCIKSKVPVSTNSYVPASILTEKEWEKMQSQIAMSSKNGNLSQITMSSRKHRGKVYTPYAFTEHGVTMLASVLRSKKAIAMNIAVVRAFTAMRHFANSHNDLFEQLNDWRKEMQIRIGKHDSQLAAIYNALENLLDTEAEKKAKEDAWKNRKRIGYK